MTTAEYLDAQEARLRRILTVLEEDWAKIEEINTALRREKAALEKEVAACARTSKGQ